MNQTNFLNILKVPVDINKPQVEDLESVVEAFPYFQSARALYIKGLKNIDSFKYNNALKTTAAYTTDRSILFDFITRETFAQNEISKSIQQNTSNLLDIKVHSEDISVHHNVIYDDVLEQQIEDTKPTLAKDFFQPKIDKEQVAHFNTDIDTPETDETIHQDKATPEDILNIGKPLEFDKAETHSFNEWLSLTRYNPINREEDQPKDNTNETERAKKFDLIEKFIEKSPRLAAKKSPSSKHNIAKAQMIQPEALMTETLARIYLEQKNYKKAIQSYKILSLKNPEKSSYFADQIKAIKDLQEQNNNE